MTHRAKVPFLPILILLIVALVVFFPVISKLAPLLSFDLAPQKRPTTSTTKVWVNLRSGFYYCSDSGVYGKLKPGAFMRQKDALQAGYSPARQHCP